MDENKSWLEHLRSTYTAGLNRLQNSGVNIPDEFRIPTGTERDAGANFLQHLKVIGDRARQKALEKEAKFYNQKGLDKEPREIERLASDLKSNRKETLRQIDEASKTAMIEGKAEEDVKKMFGDPANEKSKRYLNEKGLRNHGDPSSLRRMLTGEVSRSDIWQAGMNEAAKDQGKHLWSGGVTHGYAVTKKQLDQASYLGKMAYFGKTVVDAGSFGLLNAAGRDMLLGQAGGLSHMSRVQMAQSGVFGKLAIGGGTLFGGGLALYMASQSDDPANEFIATTASAFGMQAGWRVGKAAGGLIGNSTLARVGLGIPAAAAGALLPYVAISSLSDLSKSESVIVDQVKKWASKESFTFTPETKASTTMRQRALQKLSASAMNSRGQLLGNEAMILRGAPMAY